MSEPKDTTERSSSVRVGRVAAGCVVALYVLLFPYHPGLRSPNELCRLWQTRSLVEYGQLEINQALRDYGYVGDLSVKGGRYYPSKAPLLSFAAVPIYAALRALGGGFKYAVPELALVYFSRLLLTVAPTLLMLVLLRRFLRAYVSEAIADAITVTYALGSLAFSYSLLFMSHQPAAVLTFAAFYLLWRGGGPLVYLGAGACAGLAVVAEYTVALTVLGVLVYGVLVALRPGGASGRAIAGGPADASAATGAGPSELTQHGPEVALPSADVSSEAPAGASSSAVLGTGTSDRGGTATAPGDNALAELWPIRLRRLGARFGLAMLGTLPFVIALMAYHQAAFGHPLDSGYKYLNDAAYQPWHLGGFLGIRYPDPRAFALSFFSPLRGLFLLSPFLLLAFAGLRLLRRRDRSIFWTVVVLSLGYAYFTSSFSYDSWGWTTGPRHLTAWVPFLLLPAALALEWARARGPVWAAAGGALCAASILITGALTFVNYVPDSVTTAMAGLAWPLLRNGYLPPSLLATVVPNPYSGLLMVLLLVVAAGAVLLMTARRSLMLGGGVALALVAILSLAGGETPGDLGAQRHLQSVWTTPPGARLSLWPDARR